MSTQKYVVMDATLLNSLQTCEQKLEYRHGLNIVPNEPTSKYLEMGSLTHVILEHYYKAIIAKNSKSDAISKGLMAGELAFTRGLPYRNAITDREGNIIEPAIYEPLTNTTVDDYKTILETMDIYFDRWKNDPFIPLFVEHVMGRVLFEDEHLKIFWKAKYDLIVDTADGMLSIDHKTMSRTGEILALNNQFKGQAWILNTRNVIINRIGFQSSLKETERFPREVKSYTGDGIAEWIEEVIYWAKYLVALNENKYYPRRTTQCKQGWGKCPYYENLCNVDRGMRKENVMRFFKPAREWDVVNEE